MNGLSPFFHPTSRTREGRFIYDNGPAPWGGNGSRPEALRERQVLPLVIPAEPRCVILIGLREPVGPHL